MSPEGIGMVDESFDTVVIGGDRRTLLFIGAHIAERAHDRNSKERLAARA